jgi:hypothetical protein
MWDLESHLKILGLHPNNERTYLIQFRKGDLICAFRSFVWLVGFLILPACSLENTQTRLGFKEIKQ